MRTSHPITGLRIGAVLAIGAVIASSAFFGDAKEKAAAQSVAQEVSTPQTSRLRIPYKKAYTPLGTPYDLYETCDIKHEDLEYVRVPMALWELQRFMQCEGDEYSQTRLAGISQKVLFFKARDPNDSFGVVVQNNRVVHLERHLR